jgi:hypothetical protein
MLLSRPDTISCFFCYFDGKYHKKIFKKQLNYKRYKNTYIIIFYELFAKTGHNLSPLQGGTLGAHLHNIIFF